MIRRIALILITSLFALMPVVAQQDDLQALIESYRQEDSPAGVLYVQTSDATFGVATGKVMVGTDENATVDSRFRLASVSKTYVAVAVLQLVEQGLINLDAPISDYLSAEMADRIENAKTARVRDLLTMTSGMYEYLNDDFLNAVFEDPQHAWTAQEVLENFAYDQPAIFDAGTSFEYTNTNYVLLQLMLEKITNKPLAELIQDQILMPIGASNSYVQTPQDDPELLVHSYEDFDEDGTVEDVSAINDGVGLGDGALVSTAEDLALFYQALFIDKTLLSPDMMAEFLTDPLGSEYGMGIEIVEDETYGISYGHSGSVLGFTTDVRYYVDADALVIMLFADTELNDQLGLDALNLVIEGE